MHGDLAYVLDTGDPSLAGYRLAAGGLEPVGRLMLDADADPAQIGFSPDGSLLVVTERGADAIALFPVQAGGLLGEARVLAEICWAVVTGDGRFAFTTNFADGAVSRYAVGPDGSITLEGVAVEGQSGLRDEELSADGRFSTRSTPTRGGSSAGRSEATARSTRSAPGTGCLRRSPVLAAS